MVQGVTSMYLNAPAEDLWEQIYVMDKTEDFIFGSPTEKIHVDATAY